MLGLQPGDQLGGADVVPGFERQMHVVAPLGQHTQRALEVPGRTRVLHHEEDVHPRKRRGETCAPGERLSIATGTGAPAGGPGMSPARLVRGWLSEPDVRVIEPRQPGVLERLAEYWRYRRLTLYFGGQMLEKLYRRTWLGWIWVPLRPVFTVVTSAFVFGGLLGVSSGDTPYILFFLFSIGCWELFSLSLLWGTRSIELGRRVLRRMYVPRLTCLIGATVISMTIFGIYFLMAVIALLAFLAIDGHLYLDLGLHTLLTPIAMAMSIAIALSIACFTSPYAAEARDVRFGINYLLGFWMFLSPVIYPFSGLSEKYKPFMALNPMTAPIEMFRWGLLGEGEVTTVALTSTLVAVFGVGALGLWFFNRMESRALDNL